MKNFKTIEEAHEHIEAQDGIIKQHEAYAKEYAATIKKHEADAKTAVETIKQHEADAITAKTKYKKQEDLVMEAQSKADNTERELKSAFDEVATLSAKLDLQEKHGGENVIVSIKKKNYKLVGDMFITPDGAFTAQELAKNAKQLDRMLELKSGSLVPLD